MVELATQYVKLLYGTKLNRYAVLFMSLKFGRNRFLETAPWLDIGCPVSGIDASAGVWQMPSHAERSHCHLFQCIGMPSLGLKLCLPGR